MSDHPIQGLMKTAMEQITEMVNVNTIVGDAIETGDGDVIMPISRVNFGFAAGGSDFNTEKSKEVGEEAKHASVQLPFGGGSGGGVSITPIAFLVVGKQGVRVVPLDNQTHIVERLIDSAPHVVDRIQGMLQSFGATNRTASVGVKGQAYSTGAPGSGSAAPAPGGYTGNNTGGGSFGGYSGMGSTGSGFTNAAEVYPIAATDNPVSAAGAASTVSGIDTN